jgi:tRNA uridine 5-carbamoylmethylation protein Kti12
MKKIYIFIGPPAGGKTSTAHALAEKLESAKVIEVDEIKKINDKKLDEAKSAEASMYLKLMDSDHEELGHKTLVDIVSVISGKQTKQIEKDLQDYI